MAPKKRWQDLTPVQRGAIVVLAAAEMAATTAAAVDLVRRDPSQVRGSKWLWAPLLVVQPVGPLAYFAFGRRPPAALAA